MHENWYQGFFRSGNPFLKPKMSPSGCKFILKKFHAHTLAANVGMSTNGCKIIFLPILQYTAYILPKWSFFYLLLLQASVINLSKSICL